MRYALVATALVACVIAAPFPEEVPEPAIVSSIEQSGAGYATDITTAPGPTGTGASSASSVKIFTHPLTTDDNPVPTGASQAGDSDASGGDGDEDGNSGDWKHHGPPPGFRDWWNKKRPSSGNPDKSGDPTSADGAMPTMAPPSNGTVPTDPELSAGNGYTAPSAGGSTLTTNTVSATAVSTGESTVPIDSTVALNPEPTPQDYDGEVSAEGIAAPATTALAVRDDGDKFIAALLAIATAETPTGPSTSGVVPSATDS